MQQVVENIQNDILATAIESAQTAESKYQSNIVRPPCSTRLLRTKFVAPNVKRASKPHTELAVYNEVFTLYRIPIISKRIGLP